MAGQRTTELFEDARIIFHNFAGVEGPYNSAGERSFAIALDEKRAKALDKEGWNVKALKAREEGDSEQPFLDIAVSFKKIPPRIVVVTSRGRTTLTEDEVEMLDYADIRTLDLIVNASSWNVNGKSGIKAYLKSMFVTIEEDYLELKYAKLDDAPPRGGRQRD